MTIRHTDDGFSIGRNEPASMRVSFPRSISNRSGKVTSAVLRCARGSAGEDYLSQHGRVRVLNYPLPAEEESLEPSAKKLLLNVFE